MSDHSPYLLPQTSFTVTTTGQFLSNIINAVISPDLPEGIAEIEIYAKTGNVGYLWDGNVATTDNSIKLPVNYVRRFSGHLAKRISLISLDGGDVTVIVQVAVSLR